MSSVTIESATEPGLITRLEKVPRGVRVRLMRRHLWHLVGSPGTPGRVTPVLLSERVDDRPFHVVCDAVFEELRR